MSKLEDLQAKYETFHSIYSSVPQSSYAAQDCVRKMTAIESEIELLNSDSNLPSHKTIEELDQIRHDEEFALVEAYEQAYYVDYI